MGFFSGSYRHVDLRLFFLRYLLERPVVLRDEAVAPNFERAAPLLVMDDDRRVVVPVYLVTPFVVDFERCAEPVEAHLPVYGYVVDAHDRGLMWRILVI